MMPTSTTEVAYTYEMPGLYDGTAIYVMRDGRLINRFATGPWPAHLRDQVDAFIRDNHHQLRARIPEHVEP